MIRCALFVLPRSPRGVRVGRDLMGGYGMEVGPRLVYPPTQSLLLATILRERGFEARVHEEDHDGDAPPRDARGRPWDLVFVHVAQPSWREDLACGARFEGARVVFHGSLVRERPALALERHPDAWVVVAEEESALAVLPSDDPQTRSEPPPGCALRRGGEVVAGPPPPALALADLPLPDRAGLVHERYALPHLPGPLATTFHSRGCPFDCSFCGYVRAQGTAMRFRPAEHVAREFRELAALGYRRVVFRDAIFSVNRGRTLTLLRALRDARTGLPWQCETAPRCLDDELLAAMAESGCEHVSLGVETEDARVQHEHCGDKLPERAHLERVLRTARRLGIATRGFFMLGFPGETRAMMRATARFARGLAFDSVQFCAVATHPGTRLASQLGEPAVAASDGRRFAAEGNGVLAAAEIDREIRRAYRTHYLHPARWLALLRRPALARERWRRYRTLARRRG